MLDKVKGPPFGGPFTFVEITRICPKIDEEAELLVASSFFFVAIDPHNRLFNNIAESMIFSILAIFTGSFLLFGIQPMVARMLLPKFGGSAAVWVTCLAVYELLLLVGYAYGMLYSNARRQKKYVPWHVGLLLFSSALIIIFSVVGIPAFRTSCVPIGIFLSVCFSVGLPYVLLSANSTIIQIVTPSRRGAFWLYGVSNLGSLLGLFAYPLLLEQYVSVAWQLRLLSLGLVYYSALLFILFRRVEKASQDSEITLNLNIEPNVGTSGRQIGKTILYILIPAVSCSLLTSTTTFVCADITPLPLLWAVFLGLFLLSYTIGFSKFGEMSLPVLGLLASVSLFLLSNFILLSVDIYVATPTLLMKVKTIGLPCFAIILVFLHAWLYSIRPGKEKIGLYYLCNAIGGAVGGIFAGIVSPMIFNRLTEFPLSLAVAGMLIIVWGISRCNVVNMAACPHKSNRQFPIQIDPIAALVVIIVGGYFIISPKSFKARRSGSIYCARDFYGNLEVSSGMDYIESKGHVLFHGQTHHGIQILEPKGLENLPTTYYGDNGGGAPILAWRNSHPNKKLRFASVGLGAGTMAVWSHRDDIFQFYEISPAVISVAKNKKLFTFLSSAKGNVDIQEGDGRILLGAEEANDDPKWDILEIDAFSGDSIPSQLISDEAFDLYLKRLAPDGILAVHISSWQFDFLPLMKYQGIRLGLEMVGLDGHLSPSARVEDTRWVLFARPSAKRLEPKEDGDAVLGPYLVSIPKYCSFVDWSTIPVIPGISDDKGNLTKFFLPQVRAAFLGK